MSYSIRIKYTTLVRDGDREFKLKLSEGNTEIKEKSGYKIKIKENSTGRTIEVENIENEDKLGIAYKEIDIIESLLFVIYGFNLPITAVEISNGGKGYYKDEKSTEYAKSKHPYYLPDKCCIFNSELISIERINSDVYENYKNKIYKKHRINIIRRLEKALHRGELCDEGLSDTTELCNDMHKICCTKNKGELRKNIEDIINKYIELFEYEKSKYTISGFAKELKDNRNNMCHTEIRSCSLSNEEKAWYRLKMALLIRVIIIENIEGIESNHVRNRAYEAARIIKGNLTREIQKINAENKEGLKKMIEILNILQSEKKTEIL